MAQKTMVQFTESLELYSHAQDVVAGGTQTMSKRPSAYAYGAYPIYASRASGSHIWDIDDNEYIDLVNGLGPIVLGYCYPEVDAAIAEQTQQRHNLRVAFTARGRGGRLPHRRRTGRRDGTFSQRRR